MKRVGYDSDTGRYYYRGQGGPLWQGPQGAEYGELTRGESKSPPTVQSGTLFRSLHLHLCVVSDAPIAIDDHSSDDEEAEIGVHSRSDGYAPLAVDAVCRPSYRHGWATYTKSCSFHAILEWRDSFRSHESEQQRIPGNPPLLSHRCSDPPARHPPGALVYTCQPTAGHAVPRIKRSSPCCQRGYLLGSRSGSWMLRGGHPCREQGPPVRRVERWSGYLLAPQGLSAVAGDHLVLSLWTLIV